MGAFRHRSIARAGLGLAVAFVLALQMLLAGAVAASMAGPAVAGADAIFCLNGHDSPDGAGQQPSAKHDCCDVCSLASMAGLVPVATSVSVLISSRPHDVADFRPLTLVDEQHLPRTSQGPPKTA